MVERRTYRREPSSLRDTGERSSGNLKSAVVDLIKNYNFKNELYAIGSGLKYGQVEFFDRESFAENYNNLIRNPVYVIEFLLRKYVTNNIDVESFDNVASIEPIRYIQLDFQLNERMKLETLINDILLTFFGFIYVGGNGIKINSLFNKVPVGVINNSLVDKNGSRMVRITFDRQLYSKFIFRFWFNNMRNEYEYVFNINKDYYDIQFIGINPSTICQELEDKYGVKSTFEYNYNYGFFNFYLARALFDYYTKIKMNVEIHMDLKNGLQYELGDCLKINLSDIIPSSHNNVKLFNVIGKEIKFGKNPYVKLLLMENVLTGLT